MNALVSIVIPTYNSRRVIDHCLKSLLSQTYSNIEIIIVDDKSPDSFSIRHIKEWQNIDSRIRLFEKPVNGRQAGESRMLGVSISNGDYICFVDQDDCLPCNAIQVMYEAAVSHDADVVIGHVSKSIKVGPFVRCFAPNSLLPHTGETLLHDELMGQYYESYFGHNIIPVNAWGKLYKRSLLDRVQFPNPLPDGIPGDLLLSLTLHPYIERLTIIPDVVYHYFIGMPGVSPKYLNSWLPDAVGLFEYKWSVIEHNNITQAVVFQAIEMINYIRTYVHLCTVYDYVHREERIETLGEILQHPIWQRVSELGDEHPVYSQYVSPIIKGQYRELYRELEAQDLHAPFNVKVKHTMLRLCARLKMFS